MQEHEIKKLIGMLCATAEAIGTQITPAAAALIAGDLKEFRLDEVGIALAEVRRTCRGRLMPSDILAALARRDGRPHADEAWSIALGAIDESITVVMTAEILEALNIARAVIDHGDMVAARRTFLVAYDRLVAEARDRSKPAEWSVSLGSDKQGRIMAIEQAGRQGRITQDKARHYLAIHCDQTLTADGQAIAGLITGKSRAVPTEQVRAKLAKIRAMVGGQSPEDRQALLEKHMAEAERLSIIAQKDIANGGQ